MLASNMAKMFFKKRYSISGRYYRLAYNGIAILGLAWIAIYYQSVNTALTFWEPTIGHQFISVFILLVGLTMLASAFKNYNLREFSGMEKSGINPELCTRGLNAVVRHPIYLATLLIVWGVFVGNGSVAWFTCCVVTTIYSIIGAKLEERRLLKVFGKEYERYQKQVKMLIPFLF